MAENKERPIKRKDRDSQDRDNKAPRGRNKGRRGGKGKGREEKKPSVPPALMRGPRPVQAKPVEEASADELPPETADSDSEQAAQSAEAEAEQSPSETPAES
jgi:hypothetical protein